MKKYIDNIKASALVVNFDAISLSDTVDGYNSFTDNINTNDSFNYLVYEIETGQWEIGETLYTTAGIISRDTILASTNNNELVDFYSNTTKTIAVVTSASDISGYYQIAYNKLNLTSIVASQTLGANATSIALSNLNLNTDYAYTVLYSLIPSIADTTVALKINGSANAVAFNDVSYYATTTTAYTVSTIYANELLINLSNANTHVFGRSELFLGGGYIYMTTKYQNVGASYAADSYGILEKQGISTTTFSNITSLSFVCNTTDGFKAGSTISVYRWRL